MARLSTDKYDLPLENTRVLFQARMVKGSSLGPDQHCIELQMHLMSPEMTCMRTYDIILQPLEVVNLIVDLTSACQRIDDIQSGNGASQNEFKR